MRFFQILHAGTGNKYSERGGSEYGDCTDQMGCGPTYSPGHRYSLGWLDDAQVIKWDNGKQRSMLTRLCSLFVF